MGQLNLPSSSLIYLDTVAIIYSIERFPEYATLLDPMWQKLLSGEISIVTSELAVLETLVMLIRQANTELIRRYETLLFSSEISLIPITRSIFKTAGTIRAENNIKTPDSIHAATSISNGCDFFITNDGGFRKISGLPTLILKDVINANYIFTIASYVGMNITGVNGLSEVTISTLKARDLQIKIWDITEMIGLLHLFSLKLI